MTHGKHHGRRLRLTMACLLSILLVVQVLGLLLGLMLGLLLVDKVGAFGLHKLGNLGHGEASKNFLSREELSCAAVSHHQEAHHRKIGSAGRMGTAEEGLVGTFEKGKS